MNAAYLSALSALAGSAIGALASFATTWLTQHHQDRIQRISQESSRREKLYGEFIDQAANLFADALTHSFDDPAKMVPLYALRGKLRLFASEPVIESADAVVQKIIDTFYSPNIDFQRRDAFGSHASDILLEFTHRCRADLQE